MTRLKVQPLQKGHPCVGFYHRHIGRGGDIAPQVVVAYVSCRATVVVTVTGDDWLGVRICRCAAKQFIELAYGDHEHAGIVVVLGLPCGGRVHRRGAAVPSRIAAACKRCCVGKSAFLRPARHFAKHHLVGFVRVARVVTGIRKILRM